MFPRQHAAISGAAVLIFGIWEEVALGTLIIWTLIGTVAGVLIDVDHAFLGMIGKGKFREIGRYFFHPIEAIFKKPEEFAELVYYRGFTIHRIISHFLIFLISLYLSTFFTIFEPVSVAVAFHIVADIAEDIYSRRYRNLMTGRSNAWSDRKN